MSIGYQMRHARCNTNLANEQRTKQPEAMLTESTLLTNLAAQVGMLYLL
jgi:hypothetical protein